YRRYHSEAPALCPRARKPYPAVDVMHTDRGLWNRNPDYATAVLRLAVWGRHAIPYLDKIFPVSPKKFPVSGGTGNWLQVIEAAWRPARKATPRDRKRAIFSKVP